MQNLSTRGDFCLKVKCWQENCCQSHKIGGPKNPRETGFSLDFFTDFKNIANKLQATCHFFPNIFSFIFLHFPPFRKIMFLFPETFSPSRF